MPNTPYRASTPVLDRTDDSWRVRWNRTPEMEVVGEFFLNQGEKPAAALIHNVSAEGVKDIAKGVGERLGRQVLDSHLYSGLPYLWCALAGAFSRDARLLPAHLGAEMLKYTSNGNAIFYSRSAGIRRASAAIRRFIKLEKPITLGRAAELGGLTLSSPDVASVVATSEWTANRTDHSKFRDLFMTDVNQSEHILSLLENYIVLTSSEHFSIWPSSTQREIEGVPNIRLVASVGRFTKADSPCTYEQNGNILVVAGPLQTANETRDFVRPIWMTDGKPFVEEIAGNLVESAAFYRRGENPNGNLYSEIDLDRAAASIKGVIEGSTNELPDESISPRPALVDATVFADRITLQGAESSTSSTSLDQLEALRAHYLADATRLRDELAGSNSGQGFVHRLDSLCFSLERPLSDASSLLVATQVRALEDMLPAMQEMVADITAADVGAAVVGLGLYARQFPAWRQFVANAELEKSKDYADVKDIIDKDIDELRSILESQPDKLVDPELKKAISDVYEAAIDSKDDTISFGYMRAVGNVYRAVARYMKERRDGSIEKFNEDIDSLIAKQATNILISGIAFAATTPLLNMAAAMPHEFGWFLAVYAMINFARR